MKYSTNVIGSLHDCAHAISAIAQFRFPRPLPVCPAVISRKSVSIINLVCTVRLIFALVCDKGIRKRRRPRDITNANDYRQIFQTLKDAGIRPLVLLNGNSGSPVPAVSIVEHMGSRHERERVKLLSIAPI
jgi:hypothetical protein